MSEILFLLLILVAFIWSIVWVLKKAIKMNNDSVERTQNTARQQSNLVQSRLVLDDDGKETIFTARPLSSNTTLFTSSNNNLFVVVTAPGDESHPSVQDGFRSAGKELRSQKRKDIVHVLVKNDGQASSVKLVDSMTVVRGTHNDLFMQMTRLDGMLVNLNRPSEEQAAASRRGLEVEAQAITDARQHLPAGWTLESNVILAANGDCDLLITSPQKTAFVIDIKSRRGPPDLNLIEPTREKTWENVHDQIEMAATQLKGIPVLWLPTGDARNFGPFGEMTYASGDAKQLYRHLAALNG